MLIKYIEGKNLKVNYNRNYQESTHCITGSEQKHLKEVTESAGLLLPLKLAFLFVFLAGSSQELWLTWLGKSSFMVTEPLLPQMLPLILEKLSCSESQLLNCNLYIRGKG